MLLKLLFLFLPNQHFFLKFLLKLALIEQTKRAHCFVEINNRFDSLVSSINCLFIFFVLLAFYLIILIAICSLEIVLVTIIINILNYNFLFLVGLHCIWIHEVVEMRSQNKRI